MALKPISGPLEQLCTNVLREKRLSWYLLEIVISRFSLLIKNTPIFKNGYLKFDSELNNLKAQTPQALKAYYETHERLRPQIPEYCSPLLADLLYGLLKRNPADRIEFRTS